MKRVLLDENLDWRLIHLLDDSFIGSTVQQMGWGGIDNGELLRRAAAEFDVLLTVDKSLRFQQAISKHNLAVILIKSLTNRRVDIEPLMSQVNEAIRTVEPGTTVVVKTS